MKVKNFNAEKIFENIRLKYDLNITFSGQILVTIRPPTFWKPNQTVKLAAFSVIIIKCGIYPSYWPRFYKSSSRLPSGLASHHNVTYPHSLRFMVKSVVRDPILFVFSNVRLVFPLNIMQDVFRHSCFMYNDYAHNVSVPLWFKLGQSR